MIICVPKDVNAADGDECSNMGHRDRNGQRERFDDLLNFDG